MSKNVYQYQGKRLFIHFFDETFQILTSTSIVSVALAPAAAPPEVVVVEDDDDCPLLVEVDGDGAVTDDGVRCDVSRLPAIAHCKSTTDFNH